MNLQPFLQNTKYLLVLVVLTLTSSCTAPPKRPTYLMPTYTIAKDYKALGKRATFNNDSFTISINILTPEDSVEGEIFSALKENNFIFMELTFINKSDKQITYNSSFTHIMGSAFDYRKPMNFTDLYSVAVGKKHDLSREHKLKAVRKKFYDHMTRIPAKKTITKYLIFRPNEKETTKAVLTMKEIYVGINALSVQFPLDAIEIEVSEEVVVEKLEE